LSSLRTLRVLKALMAVDKVKPLHIILMSLFESISQLKNAVIVLLFSYSIFAIVGLIIFSGLLKYRCISESEGIYYDGEVCGSCSVGFICGKTMQNPYFGLINFDTFLQSLLQVFITTTMEGWSTIMFKVMQALNFSVVIYFIGIVLFGGFFLVNLTLAIIKLSFTNANLPSQVEIEENIYNYWQLRDLQIYEPIRPLS